MYSKTLRHHDCIVRVRIAARPGSLLVAFSPVYGYEGVTAPTIDPRPLPFTAHGHFVADPSSNQPCLNGQAITPTLVRLGGWPQPHEIPKQQTNDYVPHDPNQTGGHWLYMGISHPAAPDSIQVANYPGVWLTPDGDYIPQTSYPNAQAGSHWNAKTPGYIRYTDPDAPWKDRGARDQNGREFKTPDGQHLSVYCPALEQARREPHNPAFQIITEDIAHRMMWQFPAEDKGLYRFRPGAEREQGRILLVGLDCIRALRAQKNDDLADLLSLHLAKREMEVHRVWRERLAAGRLPFSTHGEGDWVSPAEIGIHYWGLADLRRYISNKSIFSEELDYMLKTCADFCYKWTLRWTDAGHVWYAPPYRVRLDESDYTRAPSGGMHFCWMAASNANGSDPIKTAAIAQMQFDKRFMEWT